MRGCGRDFAGNFRRLGHPGAVSFEERHVGGGGHFGCSLHEAEGDGDRNGARGVMPDETGELGTVGALLLGLDKLRCRIHLACKACRVLVICASNEFYRRACLEGRSHLRGELVKILVSDGYPHVVLSPLVEKLRRLLVKVFLRFIDIEVKGGAVLGGERSAGKGCLGDEGDKEAAEH